MEAAEIGRLSDLVNNISVSKTIEIHGLTKEMEGKGETVYSLCVGEPGCQPPPTSGARAHAGGSGRRHQVHGGSGRGRATSGHRR